MDEARGRGAADRVGGRGKRWVPLAADRGIAGELTVAEGQDAVGRAVRAGVGPRVVMHR